MRNRWTNDVNEIIRRLPLDKICLAAYHSAALNYYQANSLVNELASVKEDGLENLDRAEKITKVSYQDKKDLTLVGIRPEQIGSIGFTAVAATIEGEIESLSRTVLQEKTAHLIQSDELIFPRVKEAANKIKDAGYDPATLIIPGSVISSNWDNDQEFRASMSFPETNVRYLEISESTRLFIIEFQSEYVFVLDKCAIDWIQVDSLDISVSECKKNPLHVHINAQETVLYHLVNLDAVEVFKLEMGSDPTEPDKLFLIERDAKKRSKKRNSKGDFQFW